MIPFIWIKPNNYMVKTLCYVMQLILIGIATKQRHGQLNPTHLDSREHVLHQHNSMLIITTHIVKEVLAYAIGYIFWISWVGSKISTLPGNNFALLVEELK